MADYSVREGMTEPITFVLEHKLRGSQQTAFNLSGVTEAELNLRDDDGNISSFTISGGQLAITDAANGEITFSPNAGDFQHIGGSYKGFIRLTLSSGRLADFPNNKEFSIYVREDF